MVRSRTRQALVLTGALLGAVLAWPVAEPDPEPVASVNAGADAASADPNASEATQSEPLSSTCSGERLLVAPTGDPPRLSCREARGVVAEMHQRFAGTPSSPRPRDFGRFVSGWLDPHGLWSAAPDAPLGRALREQAEALLDEIRKGEDSNEPCAVALALGEQLSQWSGELRDAFDQARLRAPVVSKRAALRQLFAPAFQDDPVTASARGLARRLGEGLSRFSRIFPEYAEVTTRAAQSRYFPELSAEAWGNVVLAAAVRAYVPLVDPHGDWAPYEEEWSLYADDPGLDGEPRVWREITRTAVGVRIVDGAAPPLAVGDLVLSVDGMPTAGMPLEQAEQLARLTPRGDNARKLEVVRQDGGAIERVSVEFAGESDPSLHQPELDSESVRFGDGRVLVVRVPEVPDGVGQTLARVLDDARGADLAGVVLDLRGNGGGSTDGAAEVLGLFLPGAPLFPLSTHGHLVEVMRAVSPAESDRYAGPVAAMVDGYTASAAEMIAGALSAYGRGPVIGTRTFGKGCIQEYVEDHQQKGVLRVTTLLYALPNGLPVQRTGLSPDIVLGPPNGREHESDLLESLPSYQGPDVREPTPVFQARWPQHHGQLGPCSDRKVCRALSRLGLAPAEKRVAARRVSGRLGAGSGARP
ncbi:MAG: S41 family peptidase [Polyangiaceae bacterium]